MSMKRGYDLRSIVSATPVRDAPIHPPLLERDADLVGNPDIMGTFVMYHAAIPRGDDMGKNSLILLVTIFSFHSYSEPQFEDILIEGQFPRAYQVKLADIDQDGKLDIAALGEGSESFVAWFQNPTWKKFPISGTGTTDHIDLDFYDLDRDGELEVAVASDFGLNRTTDGGTVSWMDRTGDLRQPWTVHPIHAEPTSHRVRWADLDGDGVKELVNLPVVGIGTKGPLYDQTPVKLLVYKIPEHPTAGKWTVETISENLHIAHGLYIHALDRFDAILTASFEGIKAYTRQNQNGTSTEWIEKTLCPGSPEFNGYTGSSEVCVGTLRDGRLFIAAIEPWHGHQVAVYLNDKPARFSDFNNRNVIDDTFVSGHAVACADFDQDGDDEIIAGYRGESHAIYLYDLQRNESNEWKRYMLDNQVAAQGFAVGDVDQDGRLDVVAAGGSSHNVKLYLNRQK